MEEREDGISSRSSQGRAWEREDNMSKTKRTRPESLTPELYLLTYYKKKGVSSEEEEKESSMPNDVT